MNPIGTEAGSSQGLLFLIDGNNVAYRAFFALPSEIATSGGFPTNALYGFCLMMIKILTEYRPGSVIVAWDSSEKTFRHVEFEEYKAQRKPMPELLSEQWPYFTELCSAFGFVNLTLPGYEADDILATLARQAEAQRRRAVIVTGDRDALQLASPHVSIMANTRGVTEVKLYDPAAVKERFGVPPELIPDLIGLKGDTSDNIPGIPGIGEKTAAELLQQFGGLEEVLAHADEVSGPKRRELLREYREQALLSKKLASLEHDVPIDIDAAEVLPHRPEREKLRELFERFEFSTLWERVEPLLPESEREEMQAAPTARLVVQEEPEGMEALENLFDWSRTLGLAAEEGGEAIWIAQAASDTKLEDYAHYTLVRIDDAVHRAALLRPLLARGPRICHDFKSARTLHALLDQAGHDTYLAAYLLAPGRREYRLEELISEAGIALPAGVAAEGAIPAASPANPESPGSPAAALLAADLGPAAAAASLGAGVAPAAGAAVVIPLAARQEEALREQGMWDLFTNIELPTTRVLISMEQAGVHLDCYRLGEITGKIQDQLEELEARIYELAGEEFNLGSPQQLGRILFDRLGLPRQRKTKTGYSTDAKTLEALRGSHPIVELLLSHRELSKLMSTYLVALPQAVDSSSRLHTTFNQTVTATGRLSSSDPNLQNIPVRTPLGMQIRECFTAEPGNLLVVADYSQIELRIMAHLSGESTLLESFAQGEDIHARTAAEVFGLAEEDVDPLHRRYAKAVNFGIMYGISAFGLSQNLGVEREEAAAYIERYFQRLPRVKEFIEQTIDLARRQGFVTTVFGRRRPIPELAAGSFQQRSLGERLAVNSVIQGSAADIIKVAMIACHRRLQHEFPGSRLVLQVHDELVFEVPEADAEKVRDAVVEEMVRAYPMEPPLGVDAGIGPDWASAK